MSGKAIICVETMSIPTYPVMDCETMPMFNENRQHVIKPALIGAYGLWISGGPEFNWPFYHRPSTFMPVNFTTQTLPDGAAIAWLSECAPTDRTRATVGIVLRAEGDDRAAMDCFDASLRLWPENADARVELDILRSKAALEGRTAVD